MTRLRCLACKRAIPMKPAPRRCRTDKCSSSRSAIPCLSRRMFHQIRRRLRSYRTPSWHTPHRRRRCPSLRSSACLRCSRSGRCGRCWMAYTRRRPSMYHCRCWSRRRSRRSMVCRYPRKHREGTRYSCRRTLRQRHNHPHQRGTLFRLEYEDPLGNRCSCRRRALRHRMNPKPHGRRRPYFRLQRSRKPVCLLSSRRYQVRRRYRCRRACRTRARRRRSQHRREGQRHRGHRQHLERPASTNPSRQRRSWTPSHSQLRCRSTRSHRTLRRWS
ncbi:MAG: hypothetical protein ACI9KE_002827 [Polyangiales bacterium]|jgi:hypothetical protein